MRLACRLSITRDSNSGFSQIIHSPRSFIRLPSSVARYNANGPHDATTTERTWTNGLRTISDSDYPLRAYQYENPLSIHQCDLRRHKWISSMTTRASLGQILNFQLINWNQRHCRFDSGNLLPRTSIWLRSKSKKSRKEASKKGLGVNVGRFEVKVGHKHD